MANLNMGNSNIIGISYSEMNKMKSNLKRAQQMLETSQRNTGTARVQLQVDRGRLRITEDSLSGLYSEASKRKTKIDKICNNIDYTVRRFKEVDSRCAQRIRAIGVRDNVQSVLNRIKGSFTTFMGNLFGGGASLLKEGQDAFNNLGTGYSNGYYNYMGVINSQLGNSYYGTGGMYYKPGTVVTSGINMYSYINGYNSMYDLGRVGYYNSSYNNYNKSEKEDGYLTKSIKQIILGNYTNDATALGTAGQIGLGFTGLDFAADIRDIIYDVTNWKWSWDHGKQTMLDMVGIIPGIGVIKNINKASDVVKAANKAEKAVDAVKRIEKSDFLKGVTKEAGNVYIAEDVLNNTKHLVDNIKPVEATGDIAKGAADAKYQVGAYQDIKGVEGLDAHHAGQKAVMKKLVDGYDELTAPAINVPKVGHTIKGENGIVSRSTKGITSARQLLARDIKELRRVYPDIPNSRLQELIDMNKKLYPEMRK